jgi:hypothetical protein
MSEQRTEGAPAEVEPVIVATPEPPAAAPEPSVPTESDPAPPGAEAPSEADARPISEAGEVAEATPSEPEVKSEEQPAEHAISLEEPKEGEPPAEAKPEEPAPFVPYEIELPEGIELDGEPMTEFQQFARANGFSGEVVQGLVDRHIAALNQEVAAERQRQWDVFHDLTQGWLAETMADPDYGGSRFRTSQAAATQILSELVPAGERKEFNEMLISSGVADRRPFFRFAMRLHERFGEPRQPAGNATPPPDLGRNPGGRGPGGSNRGRSRMGYTFDRGGNRRRDGGD